MSRQRIKNLDRKVRNVLRKLPKTRNCDIRLTLAVWYTYDPKDFKQIEGENYVRINAMREYLPREDNIKRVRAKIQNEEMEYLPTDAKVFERRIRYSKEWRSYLKENNLGSAQETIDHFEEMDRAYEKSRSNLMMVKKIVRDLNWENTNDESPYPEEIKSIKDTYFSRVGTNLGKEYREFMESFSLATKEKKINGTGDEVVTYLFTSELTTKTITCRTFLTPEDKAVKTLNVYWQAHIPGEEEEEESIENLDKTP